MTPKPTPPLDTAAIRDRARAATPGPFEVRLTVLSEEAELDATVCRPDPPAERLGFHAMFLTGVEPENICDLDSWLPEPDLAADDVSAAKASQGWRDAVFVATARADTLALCDTVDALRARVRELTDALLTTIAREVEGEPCWCHIPPYVSSTGRHATHCLAKRAVLRKETP